MLGNALLENLDASEIIDGIPIGVAILDLDHRLQAMNRTLEVMTGFTREEAAGVPSYHIIRSNICPQSCPAAQVLENDKPVRLEGNIVNRARQKISVMITLAPIKDAQGRSIGLIESLEDISLLRELNKKIGATQEFGELLGHSVQMQKLFDIIPVVAQTDSSLLITGETGTGKDLVASVIHRLSRRAQGPFIKVNCGALPETLLESELFGHVRGAFTGAVRDKPGRFQLADNGTVYLTEIGDLPLPLQVKLLTFLDDKEFHPLGGTRSVRADVRVVAATHRNLQGMVQQGTFREDLLFRLNVVRLELAPLREREGDLRLLMEHFLNRFNKEFRKNIQGFSREAAEILRRYPFPGNVRELKNIVEYAANVCREGAIQPEHLPDYLKDYHGEPLKEQPSETFGEGGTSSAPAGILPSIPVDEHLDWRQMERRMISEALVQSRGNRTRAAKLLGWGRSTLWRKMKQHNLA